MHIYIYLYTYITSMIKNDIYVFFKSQLHHQFLMTCIFMYPCITFIIKNDTYLYLKSLL